MEGRSNGVKKTMQSVICRSEELGCYCRYHLFCHVFFVYTIQKQEEEGNHIDGAEKLELFPLVAFLLKTLHILISLTVELASSIV